MAMDKGYVRTTGRRLAVLQGTLPGKVMVKQPGEVPSELEHQGAVRVQAFFHGRSVCGFLQGHRGPEELRREEVANLFRAKAKSTQMGRARSSTMGRPAARV